MSLYSGKHILFLTVVLVLMLAVISCGSPGDGAEVQNDGFSQDVIASDPGDYPDCSGAYSYVGDDGNVCNVLTDPMQLIVITQDHDLLEYEHVLSGERLSEVARFFKHEQISNINNSVTDVAVTQECSGGICCSVTVYVDHGLVLHCHSDYYSSVRYACARWYRKEPAGVIDKRDYPPLEYYEN